jgi:hypothetical protein
VKAQLLGHTVHCLGRAGMGSQQWLLSTLEASLGKADTSICLLAALFLCGLTLFLPV